MSTAKVAHLVSGKVRELWELDEKRLLLVTTDRISAYDAVLPDPVPDRGRILTQMSAFWMEKFADLVPHHLLSVPMKPDDPELCALPPDVGDPEELAGRTAIVRRAEMLPVECIVRGYLYGSAWREYRDTGQATGMDLAPGMRIAEKLPAPVFAPSTKAVSGHDENIDMATAGQRIGKEQAEKVAALSLLLYKEASAYAAARGVIIADTKFEFGIADGELLLCDEVLTPDSSRFWYEKEWTAGEDPPALDKQFVRSWLDSSGWDRTPPLPRLPAEVIERTQARYIEVFEVLTGRSFVA